MKTSIYIDASNIRNACARSSHFELDFGRMVAYFKHKYQDIWEIKYFEGIWVEDQSALDRIAQLESFWCKAYTLSRKSYIQPKISKNIICKQCNSQETVEVLKAKISVKSNIDVYLSSEFMFDACTSTEEIHLILVSCDWDYAEMIKKVLNYYPNIKISVMATPSKRAEMNYLSSRFKELWSYENYTLINIESIRDYLDKKIGATPKWNTWAMDALPK